MKYRFYVTDETGRRYYARLSWGVRLQRLKCRLGLHRQALNCCPAAADRKWEAQNTGSEQPE